MNEHQTSNPPLSLWQDSLDCWRRLPNKAFFFLLLAAWLALFQFLGNSISGLHSHAVIVFVDACGVSELRRFGQR